MCSLCNKSANRSKAINNGTFGVRNDGKGRDGSLCKKFEGSVDASGLVVNRRALIDQYHPDHCNG